VTAMGVPARVTAGIKTSST